MPDWKSPEPGSRKRFECRKCGVNTLDIGEYYMVHNELWQSVIDRWEIPLDKYGEAGMICILCFENLLGRVLTEADFAALRPRQWRRRFRE